MYMLMHMYMYMPSQFFFISMLLFLPLYLLWFFLLLKPIKQLLNHFFSFFFFFYFFPYIKQLRFVNRFVSLFVCFVFWTEIVGCEFTTSLFFSSSKKITVLFIFTILISLWTLLLYVSHFKIFYRLIELMAVPN